MNMPEQNGLAELRDIAHKAMTDRGLEPDFPPEATRQLAGIQGAAHENLPTIRDQRNLLWCSIDNDSSKDLDQLTVAEKLADGSVKVLVAIADVDALVKAGSPLDRHAGINTTSVYTAAEIFPMLPERLSTDLTSLNEAEERLALVIEMKVAANGNIGQSEVYRALVKNYAKLAYRSVAAWLDGKDKMPDGIAKVKGLDDNLRLQDQIAQAMRRVRFLHGALELASLEPETVIRDGKIVELRVEKKNRAQDLIEDFMIAANEAAAQFLEKRGWPALRRIVQTPERWDRIQQVAADHGDKLPTKPDAKALADFLNRQRSKDPVRFPDLSLTIVKLLGPGEYVVQLPGQPSEGHFGLAVPKYSHTTAPNRRYPDLITQRLVKAALAGNPVPYAPPQLSALATHCTDQEDAAKKVERQVRKSAAAQFLAGHIGETFDAIVTGAADKGTWVRVLTPPVEGKLVTGFDKVDVGDQIKVKLVSLNVERGFIDFARSGK
jgi:VacB/RNase II family 3'-5' exoribonuclease